MKESLSFQEFVMMLQARNELYYLTLSEIDKDYIRDLKKLLARKVE